MTNNIKYYLRTFGISGLVSAIRGKITKTPILLQINRTDIKFPFFLRVPSSDVPIFDQIFIKQEYDFDFKIAPRIIVDAGANIGLASIYFANKFPKAKIIAIEPEGSNLNTLRINTTAYTNIIPIHKALWNENTVINLIDLGFGKSGFVTQAKNNTKEKHGKIVHEVQGITIDAMMEEQKIDHIDILKIDIEGAEREVFKNSSSWITKVDTLIVELHEFMKPGCIRSFYRGSNGFDDEWSQGENVYLTRNRNCLIRKCSG